MRNVALAGLLAPTLGACTLLFPFGGSERACSLDTAPLCDCGGTSLVVDHFDDALSSLWSATGTVEVREGALRVTAGGQVRTVLSHDLRNDAIEVALVDTAGADPSPVTLRVSSADVLSFIDFELRPTGLAGRKRSASGGDVTVFEGVPYDADEHRYWRIRNEGGVDGELVWETSRERSRWKEHWSAPALPFIPAAYVSLHVQPSGDFEASFDDVRGGDRAREHCPAQNLVDEFSDGPAPPLWNASGSGECAPREEGGELILSGGETCYSIYTTSTAYILEGSSIEVEITALPTGAGQTGMLQVASDQQHWVQLLASEGTIRLLRADTGAGTPFDEPIPYASGPMRWRLTQRADLLQVETSEDGGAWELQGSTDSPFGPLPVTVRLDAYGDAMRVGSVNTPSR